MLSRFSRISRFQSEPDKPDNQINQITRIMTYEDVTVSLHMLEPVLRENPPYGILEGA